MPKDRVCDDDCCGVPAVTPVRGDVEDDELPVLLEHVSGEIAVNEVPFRTRFGEQQIVEP